MTSLLAACAATESPVPGWKWQAPEDRPFPIMAWYGPPAHLMTDEVWANMAAAGFSLCLNSFHGPPEAHVKSLELGERHGIGVMLGGQVNWEWAEDEEKVDKLPAHVKEVAAKWSGAPALAAYVFKDEPGAVSFQALARTRKLLARAAPGHWAYINLFPNYAPVTDEMNFLQSANYTEYVTNYMDICRPEVLSYDHYGIRTGDKVTPEYFENLEIIRAAAMEHDVPFWAFALSTPLRPVFPMPTEGHLRFQLYCCLAYGAKGLQHFTYCRAEGTDGLIDHQGNRTPTYDLAKKINWEIQHMGPVLLSLKSTAVYHTAPPPAAEKSYPLNPVADYGSTKKFEGHGGLLSCSGPPALLGFFDGPNASKYFMIVNRNPAKAAEFTLTFSDEVTSLGEIDRSRNGGPIRPVETTDGKLKLKLTAGDGRLFQLKAAP